MLPYLEWQASPWLPQSTPMSVHVTQRSPGREGEQTDNRGMREEGGREEGGDGGREEGSCEK